ncbi:MAG TPA: DUF2914 domain-containing protein [Sandaracinaceae bacterium LLY-WYZ-13_1]|nr:DUF2914 domain-containing protein [Sandaracinaceae bacterium LLY-WYZ-13_1]
MGRGDHRILALTSALGLTLGLAACGHDAGDDHGPKARTDEAGPIERELRRRSGDDQAPARGPIARADSAGGGAAERREARDPEPVARSNGERGVAAEPAGETPDAPTAGGAAPVEVVDRDPGTADGAEASDAERPEDAEGGAPAPPAIELARVVVARDVADREPVGPAPLRADAERAYLFVEASNEGPEDATLSVEWIGPDGTRGRPIDLELPVAPRWRTWATTRRVAGTPGRWRVVVRSADRVLADRAFDVRPTGDEA